MNYDYDIIDSFAGGGGTATGIEMALGRSPDIAVNHDEAALAMHAANHPDTLHLSENIWQVDPFDVIHGRRIGLAWFSPDCKHFSKAKGGKPVKKNIRDLAWVVVRWARLREPMKPRVIIVENVEEFLTWGPLVDGKPDPERKGEEFQKWIRELRRLGYKVEHREQRACDYGAPTIRKRLFIIARCDGQPIVWPEPTHGRPTDPDVLSGKKLPWRTAAECIDWSLPCPSIFDTRAQIMDKYGLVANRPLAPNTLARVARGVKRYVIDAKEPFFIHVQHGSNPNGTMPSSEPMRTITAHPKGGGIALVQPVLGFIQRDFGNSTGHPASDPLATITAGGGGHAAIVAAFMAQHNTGVTGHPVDRPLSTLTQRGTQQQVVATYLMSMKGTQRSARSIEEPLAAITAGGLHATQVCAFLTKYYGTDQSPELGEPFHTVTTKDRFSLVTVNVGGVPHVIYDIGMRMLSARELFNAQGFPDDYIIDLDLNGKPLTKTAKVEKCGNSVCPPHAAAIIGANCQFLIEERAVA